MECSLENYGYCLIFPTLRRMIISVRLLNGDEYYTLSVELSQHVEFQGFIIRLSYGPLNPPPFPHHRKKSHLLLPPSLYALFVSFVQHAIHMRAPLQLLQCHPGVANYFSVNTYVYIYTISYGIFVLIIILKGRKKTVVYLGVYSYRKKIYL